METWNDCFEHVRSKNKMANPLSSRISKRLIEIGGNGVEAYNVNHLQCQSYLVNGYNKERFKMYEQVDE